jgi:hypothetical protein
MVSIVVSLISQVFLIEVSRVVKKQPCTFGCAEITLTLQPSAPQKNAAKQQLLRV